MIALTRKRRIAYLVFGLPAVYMSVLAPFSIYYGLWAYLSGTHSSGYWLMPTVIMPVLGISATVSALILLFGPGQPSSIGKVFHTALLGGGIAVAFSLVGPTVGFGFSIFLLSPAVVGLMLIRHLWGANQPALPADAASPRG